MGRFSDGLGSVYTTVCATTDTGDVVCWQGAYSSGQSIEHYPGDYTSVSVVGSGFCAVTAAGEVSNAAAVRVRRGVSRSAGAK